MKALRSLAWVIALAGNVVLGHGKAIAQVPGTEGVTALFSLEGRIAAYDESKEALRFFSRERDGLKEGASIHQASTVWEVTELPMGLLIASGMGRKNLNAPISIELTPRAGGVPQVVFTHNGERNQVTYLRYVDGKVWLTYFESKYVTKTGYLEPAASFPWKFVQVGTYRLGDVTDVRGGLVVVGRPYGDVQGQDGDIVLLRGQEQTLLPSYRGVRAAHFFGAYQNPRIVIGDGWHQNYGQLAQGRVSILTRDAESMRYALQVIDNDTTQYGFSKFIDLTFSTKSYIVALGNTSVNMYGPEPLWKRTSVYNLKNTQAGSDIALVEARNQEAWIAALDSGLQLLHVTPEQLVTSSSQ